MFYWKVAKPRQKGREGGGEEGGRVGERERGREGQRERDWGVGVSVVGVCVGDKYKWREGGQLCTHAHTDWNLTQQLRAPHNDHNTNGLFQ